MRPDAVPIMGDIGDAYQHLSFAYVIHDAFERFGEIVLWNPYFGGGIPWTGFPLNSGATPITLAYIWFGELFGVKILMISCLFIGALGIYFVPIRVPQP